MGIICPTPPIPQEKQDIVQYINKNQHQQWSKYTLNIVTSNKFVPEQTQYHYLEQQASLKQQTQIQYHLKNCYLNFDYEFQIVSEQIQEICVSIINKKKQNNTKKIRDMRRSEISIVSQLDESILNQLSSFSKFCDLIKIEWLRKGSEINQIVISFIKNMISEYKVKIKKSASLKMQSKVEIRQNFVKSAKGFINSLVLIIQYKYKIQMNPKNILFRKIHLQNLVTSLLFQDKQFYHFVQQIYLFAHTKIANGQNHFEISNPQFSLDQKTLNLYYKKVMKLDAPYRNSLKIFGRIIEQQQPIKKLQTLFMTVLTIEQQINFFYESKDYDFERSELLQVSILEDILKYLMYQLDLQKIAINIQITNDFIDQNYKSKNRGCLIIIFLNIVKNNMLKQEN